MMTSFNVTNLPLQGLKRLTRKRSEDHRGHFSRLFCSEALQQAGWTGPIAQINHSVTRHKGTVRGLHYQCYPHAEIKLVTCMQGEIWDVVVDLRPDSPTFLHWHAEILSAENDVAILIPTGFAHGFQTLVPDVELIYCHTVNYQPEFEAGLRADDPILDITWPLTIDNRSDRDTKFSLIGPSFEGVRP